MRTKSASKKLDRIEEMLQRKLAAMIPLEVRDPRLPALVTITGVTVSADLSYAKVYFTVFDANNKDTETILNHASGYLRTLLSKTSKLRTMPKLQFIYDASIDYAQHMAQLMNKIDVDSES